MDIGAKVASAVKQNSFIFLNKAIHELCSHNDKDDEPLNVEVATLSVSLIQIAFELILISYSVKRHGIRSILSEKNAKKTDIEIECLFESDDLPTKNINELIDELQEKHNLFQDDHFALIKVFQRFRNKLVHIHCKLHDNDRYDLKHEIIHYIVHVIVPLLSIDDDPWSESMDIENCLDKIAFKKLISFGPYLEKMQELAMNSSSKVFRCVECGHRAVAIEIGICYVCNFDYDDREFVDCHRCKTKGSIIFDHLNISENNNMMRGLCLNCNEDDIVFKCPKCEEAYAMEGAYGIGMCSDDGCVNS